MSSFMDMEWNGKWDLENLMMFGSKVSESPKKLGLMDWGINDEEEMDAGSFNLSGGGSGNGHSESDLGIGSSAKSSVSASTDSSPEDGSKMPPFGFEALKGCLGGDFKMEQGRGELSGTSPPPESSVGSVEPLIGLKLGKRTYFENSCSGGNAKSPSSVIPVPSTIAAKKTKPPSAGACVPRCQVEGCNVDLSSAKEYHRKHRVCDSHSKYPKVIIAGLERRFCQQCSRFHSLSEFDEKKRSCRRRLSDHNARRRKPQQDAIQFNSSRLPSSFYGGRQQINFVLNGFPSVHSRNAAYPHWETRDSMFTITRAFPLKPDKAGGTSGQPQATGNQLPNTVGAHSSTSNGFLAPKGTSSPVFSQAVKDSILASPVVAAPEFCRALSLLSNNSWGTFEPGSVSLDNPSSVHVSRSNTLQTAMHVIPEGVPLSSSEFWPNTQQSSYPSVQNGSTPFEGIQPLKESYYSDFYRGGSLG